MPVERIDSFSDPRVSHYRNLKDRELDRQGFKSRVGRTFGAEQIAGMVA